MRVFVFGSSKFLSLAISIQGHLNNALPEAEVKLWKDHFSANNKPTFVELMQAIKEYDKFVCILTPDVKLPDRDKPGSFAHMSSDNVCLELGLAAGAHSWDNVAVLHVEENSELEPTLKPSDMKSVGIHTIKEDDISPGKLKAIVGNMASFFLQNQSSTTRKNAVHALSFIYCKPNHQDKLDHAIHQDVESGVFADWNVTRECSGVLFGSLDYFVIHTSPNLIVYENFLRLLRGRHFNYIESVDTRIIFPTHFWTDGCLSKDKSLVMLLLSCMPQNVEDAYNDVLKGIKIRADTALAELEHPSIVIRYVGVLSGDHDMFILLECDNEKEYREVIRNDDLCYKVLHLNKGYLTKNTTSISIG